MKKSAVKIASYYIGLTVIIIGIAVIFKKQFMIMYENPEFVKGYISSMGFWGPLILMALMIFQVIFMFIPGTFVLIAAGYAFGIFWGTLYSWIALLIGSSILFLIGRKLGRPFVEKIVKKDTVKNFDDFFTDRTILALTVSRTIPIGFPHDVISLVVSLANISFPAYLMATAIGFIPHTLIIVALGNQITTGFTYTSVIAFSIIGFLITAFLLWKPVKQQLEHRKRQKAEYLLARESNIVKKISKAI